MILLVIIVLVEFYIMGKDVRWGMIRGGRDLRMLWGWDIY